MELGYMLGMSQIETVSQNCSHSYACNVPDRRWWFPMENERRDWFSAGSQGNREEACEHGW